MLISETTGDFELLSAVEQAAKVGGRLAACIETARGAFSYNTERTLRANVEIFAFWCRQHVLEAVPASAPTLHTALGHTNSLESAPMRFALQRIHPRYPFVDGTLDLEVLSLLLFVALSPEVEPDGEDPHVVLGTFADQRQSSRRFSGGPNLGRKNAAQGKCERSIGADPVAGCDQAGVRPSVPSRRLPMLSPGKTGQP